MPDLFLGHLVSEAAAQYWLGVIAKHACIMRHTDLIANTHTTRVFGVYPIGHRGVVATVRMYHVYVTLWTATDVKRVLAALPTVPYVAAVGNDGWPIRSFDVPTFYVRRVWSSRGASTTRASLLRSRRLSSSSPPWPLDTWSSVLKPCTELDV